MSVIKKLTAVFMALIIVAGLLPVPAASAASDHAQIVRLGGKNRYATASNIADQTFEQSEIAILASGENYADALAAAPLAHYLNAPILLTGKNTLSTETVDRLSQLRCSLVLIMGGTGAVSENVENSLVELGYDVERVSGKTRYETAVAVAMLLHEMGSPNTHEVFIACGTNYPDALSANPVAALKGSPILYAPPSGQLDETTTYYLTQYNTQRAYILGGTGAVGESAESCLDSVGVERTSRLSGKNRYDTSLLITKTFLDTFPSGDVAFATGKNYPDALAGSVFAAVKGIPVLLSDNKTIHDGIKSFLAERDPETAYAFGGTGVISDHIIYCHLPRCESLTTTKATTTTAPIGQNAKYVVNPDYKSKYYIVVFAGESQSVAIYSKDKSGKYSVLEKCFTCSTGAKSSPTRTGQYKIWRRFEWRLLVGDVYGQYSTSISSDYLFHSVPYFKANPSSLDMKEYDKLGTPASHGCIRLCVRDSKWIYDNCPNGTQVNIVNASGPKGAGVPKRNTNSRYNGWDPSDPNTSNPYIKYPTTTTTKATTATTKTTTTTKATTTTTKTTTSTSATTTTTTTAAPVTMFRDDYADRVLELVNEERAKEGLEPLKKGTDAMETAAKIRASETVDSFSHTRPNGSSWSTALDEQNQFYLSAGENIARGYTSPEEVVDAWMNSPGHRANILSSSFTHLSIGCYSRNNYLYWAQLFCTIIDDSDVDLDSFPARVLELVNQERVKEGLSPLEQGTEALEKAVQVRADETTELFSHTRPDGSKCFTAITDQGQGYMSAGENIARGFSSPDDVVAAWMNSEGHRANIMDEDFTMLSTGCAVDEEGRICWVQLFIG